MRSPHAVAQQVGSEIVVVDAATKQAHALSGLPADLWRAAGLGTWLGPVDDEFRVALASLIDAGLFVERAGISRRAMLARTGVVAAGVGIASIALPSVEAAASGITGTPSISLSPTLGPAGTTVTVVGSNFFSGTGRTISSVTIGGVLVTPSNTVISSTGTVSFTFTVPGTAPLGVDNVSVTDNHNNVGNASFTVVSLQFTATGAFTFTAPAHTTSIDFYIVGGGGGAGAGSGTGGNGGTLSGTFSVPDSASATHVSGYVGRGAGVSSGFSTISQGGNGSPNASSSGGGGGATGFWVTAVTAPIAVAGAGGGGGGRTSPGNGGNGSGGASANPGTDNGATNGGDADGGNGGHAGTVTTAGAPGSFTVTETTGTGGSGTNQDGKNGATGLNNTGGGAGGAGTGNGGGGGGGGGGVAAGGGGGGAATNSSGGGGAGGAGYSGGDATHLVTNIVVGSGDAATGHGLGAHQTGNATSNGLGGYAAFTATGLTTP